MIEKSEAIMLHTVRCATGSTLAKIYTAGRGIMTVSLPSIKQKGSVRASIFQPFALLELDIDIRENREIQRLVEARLSIISHAIICHPVKLSIALFMAELVSRAVLQRETDEQLFLFLRRSIELLELSREGIANFHLLFMSRLMIHLGFFPHTEGMSEALYFDLLNGRFLLTMPTHPHYRRGSDVHLLNRLLQTGFSNAESLLLNRSERNTLVELLLDYYRRHIGPMPPIRSLEVLRELY